MFFFSRRIVYECEMHLQNLFLGLNQHFTRVLVEFLIVSCFLLKYKK